MLIVLLTISVFGFIQRFLVILPTFVVGMTKDMDHYEAHPVDTCLLQSYSQEATQVWQWIYDYEPLFLLPLLRRIWIYVVYFVAGNYLADFKWPLFQKQLFDDRGKWQFDTLVLEDKVPSSLADRKLLYLVLFNEEKATSHSDCSLTERMCPFEWFLATCKVVKKPRFITDWSRHFLSKFLPWVLLLIDVSSQGLDSSSINLHRGIKLHFQQNYTLAWWNLVNIWKEKISIKGFTLNVNYTYLL